MSFDGTASGYTPNAVIMDSHGNLYGTTQRGGSGNLGTIYEIPAGSSSVNVLANFSSPEPAARLRWLADIGFAGKPLWCDQHRRT